MSRTEVKAGSGGGAFVEEVCPREVTVDGVAGAVVPVDQCCEEGGAGPHAPSAGDIEVGDTSGEGSTHALQLSVRAPERHGP